MRCLIIDDDPSPRALMERLINSAGHRSRSVSSGPEAIAALTNDRYDVALVDLEMPGMDGAATIESLRAVAPELRVLVVSGYDDRRHVMAALDAGANGYIVKDEIGESLTKSLQEVRAGHSPLSPRVAAVIVRQMRKSRGTTVPPPRPATPTEERRRVTLRFGYGTGRLPKVTPPAPERAAVESRRPTTSGDPRTDPDDDDSGS